MTTQPAAAPSGGDTAAPAATPAQPAAAAATPAAQAAAPAATPAAANPPADPAAPATDPAKPASEFKINEEYKDKPWASKIKSEEDLYKQVDELTGLIGKKTITPTAETLAKMSDTEREELYKATRPASVDEYKFADSVDPAFKEGVGKIFMEEGIDAFRGNRIVEKYLAAEKTETAKMYQPEGMQAEMEKVFGKGYDPVPLNKILKGTLTPETYAHINAMPNFVLAALHKSMSEFTKAYGITESNAHTAAGHGTGGAGDLEKTRNDLRAKIAGLKSKPHEASEKQALIDQLNATYNNDTRRV